MNASSPNPSGSSRSTTSLAPVVDVTVTRAAECSGHRPVRARSSATVTRGAMASTSGLVASVRIGNDWSTRALAAACWIENSRERRLSRGRRSSLVPFALTSTRTLAGDAATSGSIRRAASMTVWDRAQAEWNLT
jgi:hypothetical protein